MIRRIYLKEVEKINQLKQNPELRSKMDEAYNLLNKIDGLNDDEKERAQTLVREILEAFFKDSFSESFSVPIEFIESPLGKMLFSLKFGVPEREYTATEVTAIMGRTRALISYDKKTDRLASGEKGKNTVILEKDLIAYMKSKNMSMDEIDERLKLFRKLKIEGFSNDEIKIKIKEYIKDKYSL